LVQETENPALNGQSVLLRAMLADSLFPGKFDTLIADELSYSAAAMFLLKSRRQGWFPQLRERLLAILSGSPDSGPEETRPPAFLTAPASFSLPELMDALVRAQVAGFDDFPSPFAARWRDALDTIPTPPMPVPVLELGCGSANDSRYFSRYGLARFLRYTGVDFTRKNIANAQARCPESTFIAADVAALPFADDAFDYTFACDLWEHIPEAHFEKALREALRVTRKELWFSFFNLDWFPGHEFDSSGDRPMNRLSREQLKDFFAREAGGSYRIDIAREWPERFPGYTHYNPNAALLVVCARKRG
jgi:SAM-dependent methyltransferase